MMKELDVFPHNLAVSSPLVVDGMLYATTGNGVDEGHVNIPSPKAPSFIALDAKTGTLVWESNLPGDKIFHGTWSNPTYGGGQGPAPGDLPGRRRLDLQPRAQDRQAALEVQRQPAGHEVHPGRPRHRQRGHRERRPLRRQAVLRRGPGPRARRGRRQLLVHRRHEGRRHHRDGRDLASRRQRLPPHHLDRGHQGRHRLRLEPLGLPLRARREDGPGVLAARHAGRGVGFALRGRRPASTWATRTATWRS